MLPTNHRGLTNPVSSTPGYSFSKWSICWTPQVADIKVSFWINHPTSNLFDAIPISNSMSRDNSYLFGYNGFVITFSGGLPSVRYVCVFEFAWFPLSASLISAFLATEELSSNQSSRITTPVLESLNLLHLLIIHPAIFFVNASIR